LHISDKVDFKRKVSQAIMSSPYVKLEDGLYTLTAMVKNSSGFTKLEMYATSSGKQRVFSIKGDNALWKSIKIEHILVKEGKVEIGFNAAGAAGAFCNVDDVVFEKSK
jgi:hypothetical protein